MTKMLLFALAMLAPVAFAQPQDESSAMSQRTLQGCVQGSDGNYTLTDKYGRIYQLGNETSKPAAYVGREVQIVTSIPASVAITSTAGAEESAAQAPTLMVEEMKQVAGTCQSGQ